MTRLAKVKWNVNEASISRILGRYIERNTTNVENIIDDYAFRASEMMRNEFILRDSPTGTRWHVDVNNQRGNPFGARVESGNMAGAVGFDSYSMNADGVVGAEFGLPSGRNYFMDQEFGFKQRNRAGSRQVRGMHAADKTIDRMKPYFRKQMLSRGFLKGRKDARGTAVLAAMAGGQDFFGAWVTTAPQRSQAQMDAWQKIVDAREIRDLNAMLDRYRAQSSRDLANLSISGFPNLAKLAYQQSPRIRVSDFLPKIGK